MTHVEPGRDCIGECALRQGSGGTMASVYAGLSDEDRVSLARMITGAREHDDSSGRWSRPPDEL